MTQIKDPVLPGNQHSYDDEDTPSLPDDLVDLPNRHGQHPQAGKNAHTHRFKQPTSGQNIRSSHSTKEESMTINLQVPDITELKPKLTVFGVGGAGGNAVNNMIKSGLEGVEFVVANTDAQALTSSRAEKLVQMGLQVTEGLGAGSRPEIGRQAAEEVIDEINDYLNGSHMAFITAGMGGGTGTGAAPIVARAARDRGILTVGVVTKPFQFEGARRMRLAESGIEELQANVDTLIVIPNQNLFRIANEKTTFADAFAMADQVLNSGVSCITDLMVKEGLINLDFADVRSVMKEMGKAMMGTGEASGESRAVEAAEAAIANPLLDETSMAGAQGLLISITGGNDLTLFEVDEAATRIREEVDPDANIILGATFDEALEGIVRVSVVATGIEKLASHASTVTQAGAGSSNMPPILDKKLPKPDLEVATAALNAQAAIEAELSINSSNGYVPAQSNQIYPPSQSSSPEEPKASPAKSDPAVTITRFAPSPEALQLAQNASNSSLSVQQAFNAKQPPAMKGPIGSSQSFEAPFEEAVVRSQRMPSVDDFPKIVQEEMRAKSSVSHDLAQQDERGALGLIKRITTATLGNPKREDDIQSTHLSTSPLTEVTQCQDVNQPSKPAAQQTSYMPKCNNLDGRGRVPAASQQMPDEDQLEIPAFLRRQAQ